MRDAEREHWRRVDSEHWSGPPTGLVRDAFEHLGVPVSGAELLGAMDGYAKAIAGWSTVDPDAAGVLKDAARRAIDWTVIEYLVGGRLAHADLVMHGLAGLLDAIVYTSTFRTRKPHRTVFQEVARRLDVMPDECVMIGDRMSMTCREPWKQECAACGAKNQSGFPSSIAVPTARSRSCPSCRTC